MWSRRRAALTALVVLAGATAALATRAGTGGGDDGLGAALADIDEASAFSLRHLPRGTRVVDCFVPNRELLVDVDLAAESMVVSDADGRELGRRIDGAVYLVGRQPAGWIAAELPIAAAVRRELVDRLGPDVVGYLFADGLPADPVTAARELAGAADTVEGASARRYVLALGDDAIDGVDGAVTVEIEVFEGRVREIAVAPAGEGGWRLRYDRGTPLRVEPPRDPVPLTAASAADLTTSTDECDLPL